ncbi:hypothetical protein [Actinoplanes sp. M2I2]|uniref:hypothetical protein n=1 Tax=Actinoplanes sp. M2I2 TaxID=1734444 RepID=UPI0020227AF6|nr:hypothetical protein [Actinoplanes sp. M2I2]
MLFTAKCPVAADEQEWIDGRMARFLERFGTSWLGSPVILPTAEFFPGAYTGTEQDMRRAVVAVCGFMGVDDSRIFVKFPEAISREAGTARRWTRVAGTSSMSPAATSADTYTRSDAPSSYRRIGRNARISLDPTLGRHPLLLLATIARELAYDRLLTGKGRLVNRELQPVSELLTVFLGFGVITANAAFEFSHTTDQDSRRGQWSASRLGLLTEPMYGYALARYAMMRGEPRPDWARFVDSNPRAYLRKGVRFIRRLERS